MKCGFQLGFLVVVLALAANAFHAQRPVAASPAIAPGVQVAQDRVLIRVPSGVSASRLRVQDAQFISPGWQVATLQAGETPDQAIARLRQQGVEAEPDYIYHTMAAPNDPLYIYQWNFRQVQAEEAWTLSTGAGVTVAVLDTGLSTQLTDGPQNVATGYNALSGQTNTEDNNGHGSHVSNTIAERTNNNLGLAGLSYDSTILPIVVCDSGGSCPVSSIAVGVIAAIDRGARVVNMSLGGPLASVALADAVNYALARNVVVVAAMGNDGGNVISYPAAYPGVIAVGATQFTKQRASYSNRGNHIWVAAPGGSRSQDLNNDGEADLIFQQSIGPTCSSVTLVYCGLQGTSMATPHVSATVALMLARVPSLTPSQVRQILAETAQDLSVPGFDIDTGYGLIQAYDAIQRAITVGTTNLPNIQVTNVFIAAPKG